LISTPVLRGLQAAGALTKVVIKGVPGGFVVTVTLGMEEQILQAQRGGARTFKRLDVAAAFLRRLGIFRFEVDSERWNSRGLV
jgi:hypothetical protein